MHVLLLLFFIAGLFANKGKSYRRLMPREKNPTVSISRITSALLLTALFAIAAAAVLIVAALIKHHILHF